MRFWILVSTLVLISKSTRCQSREGNSREVEKYFCKGECNIHRARCSCHEGCLELGTCCTDYTESCQGGHSWTKESCTPEDEMICPKGYENTVLMLSIDGFRSDYFNRNLTPTLEKLMRCGVSTPYMIPVYPSKTFPNHYTMATGLYPESHGIIANKMYNHDTEEEFLLRNRTASTNPEWWKGEPIWVTASNAGLKSAAFFWPGSDVNITRYPDYWKEYDESIDVEERAYTMLNWMNKDDESRPKMMVMYTSTVDSAGHLGGPSSWLLDESLKKTDQFIEMIMNGLRDRKLDTCVNVIIVGDHGMAGVDCEKNVTYLEDYGVDISSVYLDIGPYARIGKSKKKDLWHLFDPVETKKELQCQSDETRWQVYLKYEYMPKRYHYANNPWIEDLHLVMDQAWWVGGTATEGGGCDRGEHGYDPQYSDMRTIFLAHGSGLKRNYTKKEPFEGIELYNLCAGLLGIQGAENNGTNGALYDVMANSPGLTEEGNGQKGSICTAADDSQESLGCQDCEGNVEDEANRRLNSYALKDSSELERKHMLYGKPRIFDDEAEYCVLYQHDFLTTYDKKLRMPRIVSFVLDENNSWNETMTCLRRDVRLPDSAITACSDYNNATTWAYLFHPAGSSSDAVISDATVTSNTIPIHDGFSRIWEYVQKLMIQWAARYDGITVHVGPIFDYNYDGHADDSVTRRSNGSFLSAGETTVIPTHYFVIMTKCKDISKGKSIRDCSAELDVDVQSFILPNYKEDPCHEVKDSVEDWAPAELFRHVSRIRDIELLTKLSFFTNWVTAARPSEDSHLEAVRRKIFVPKHSTFWPTTMSACDNFKASTPFILISVYIVSQIIIK